MRRAKLALVLILGLAAGHAAVSTRHGVATLETDGPPVEIRRTPWTSVQVPALVAGHTLAHRDSALPVLRKGDDHPRRPTAHLHGVR